MGIGAVSPTVSVVVTPPSGEGRRIAAPATSQLSTDEQRVVTQLQQTDRNVRAHEMAHLAAGAGLVQGGPSFTYQRGPDGQLYAVGGEVSIDTSPGATPEETIRRAQQIRSAALAPADPSAQDRQVAAAATRMEMEARIQAAAESRNEDGASAGGAAGLARDFERVLEPDQRGTLIDTYA